MREISFLIDLIQKPITGEWGSGPGNVKVLRTTNFTNEGNVDYSDVVLRDIELRKINTKKLFPGDIIIEKSGGSPTQPVGRVVYFENEGTYLCNNFTSILRPKTDKVYPKYLLYILYANHKYRLTGGFQNKTTGIINLQLSRYVKKTRIPLPPLPQQKKIAAILDAADAYRQKTKELIKKYDELSQSLFLDMFGDPVSNPKGWEKKKLNEASSKISVGFVGTCEPFYCSQDEGVPMIRTGNLGEGFLKLSNVKYVTHHFHDKQKKSQLFDGDILIARHGDNGKAVLYKGEFTNANCLNIVILRPSESLKSIYVQYLINSNNTRKKIASRTGGATQKVVNTKEIQKLDITVPPISLQCQFSKRIQEIESQKAQAQKSLEKAEKLFNSLLQRAFKGELV